MVSTANMVTDTASLNIFELLGISYLFGHPITHSLSPLLHETVYNTLNLPYTQIPFPSRDISQFLSLTKDPRFYGASITMPHKIAIMQHLDHLTDEARQVGACNTVFIRENEIGGKRSLCGTNTDVIGIREAFFQNASVPKQKSSMFQNRPGLVIGGGGAARSAVYAMKRWMQCDPIYLVNRDAAEVEALMVQCEQQQGIRRTRYIHVRTIEQADQIESPRAIVSCIPDLPPVTEEEVQVRRIVETILAKADKGILLEMCYHPSPWTQIAALAEKAQWQVILGTEAMIWQGLEQDRYWTGLPLEKLPVREVKDAIESALLERKRKANL